MVTETKNTTQVKFLIPTMFGRSLGKLFISMKICSGLFDMFATQSMNATSIFRVCKASRRGEICYENLHLRVADSIKPGLLRVNPVNVKMFNPETPENKVYTGELVFI